MLLRQLTRMDHEKAQGLLGDTPITVFNLHPSEHAVAMPAPGGLGLRPAGLLYQQEQGGLRAPPGFKCLPDRTGAWHERHSMELVFQTHAQGAATIGLTNQWC